MKCIEKFQGRIQRLVTWTGQHVATYSNSRSIIEFRIFRKVRMQYVEYLLISIFTSAEELNNKKMQRSQKIKKFK